MYRTLHATWSSVLKRTTFVGTIRAASSDGTNFPNSTFFEEPIPRDPQKVVKRSIKVAPKQI